MMYKRVIILLSIVCTVAACGGKALDLEKEAETVNKKCPVMIDSDTRLDMVEVKEPNTLVYKYSLVKLTNDHIDTVMFYRALWPGLISNIKVSAEMKTLRERNTHFEYYYQDKNGKAIYTFRIGPGDYK